MAAASPLSIPYPLPLQHHVSKPKNPIRFTPTQAADFQENAASTSSPSSNSESVLLNRRRLFEMGVGLFVSTFGISEAKATRIEYYATVGEKLCDMNFVKSGLGYCDVAVGNGVQPPPGELINIHYTARFADGTVFDSSYKRGRPLTLRIGRGRVLPGLDQGILGGGGVPPMHVGGKRKLMIPPLLAYGPEPAGCFQGDCNIPGNATLLYDILFVGVYK